MTLLGVSLLIFRLFRIKRDSTPTVANYVYVRSVSCSDRALIEGTQ